MGIFFSFSRLILFEIINYQPLMVYKLCQHNRTVKEIEAISIHKQSLSTILETERAVTPEEQEKML
jgi:hypothetical protein